MFYLLQKNRIRLKQLKCNQQKGDRSDEILLRKDTIKSGHSNYHVYKIKLIISKSQHQNRHFTTAMFKYFIIFK